MRFLKQWVPALVWAAVIIVASNDTFSSDNTREWLERIVGRELPDAVNFSVRKLAHLIEYAILGILAWRAERRVWLAIAFAVVIAAIDETRQGFTMTRSGSPFDVLLDTFGATIGALAVQRLSSRRR